MVSGYNKTTNDTQLALKAPLASPTFTGTPKSVTPATADNSTLIATTAFVKAQGYAPTASPTFTGTVNGITKSMVGLTNVDNTSDVTKFSTFGVLPTIYYTSTTAPARTVPSGYSGPVIWNSEQYPNAAAPAALEGDRWARVRTS